MRSIKSNETLFLIESSALFSEAVHLLFLRTARWSSWEFPRHRTCNFSLRAKIKHKNVIRFKVSNTLGQHSPLPAAQPSSVRS